MKLPVIDLHNDTYSKKWLFKKYPSYEKLKDLNQNKNTPLYDVDLNKIRSANIRITTTSLFMFNSFMDKPLHHALSIISGLIQDIKKNKDFYLLKSKKDLLLEDKYAFLLSIEGLEIIEGNLNLIDVFHELGVRMIAPTWNRLTPWFSPVTENTGAFSSVKDLTDKLNEFNFLVDISHLSDQSVFDLEKMFNGTIMASHSDFRSLNPAKRNVSDDIIKIIKERNGLIGINFYPNFLRCEIPPDKKIPDGFLWIKKMLDHCDILNCWDNISFGSDFDGIEEYSPGLENPDAFITLAQYLKNIGLENDKLEKLFYKNALRVITKNLPE